jgi:hypothetical protein
VETWSIEAQTASTFIGDPVGMIRTGLAPPNIPPRLAGEKQFSPPIMTFPTTSSFGARRWEGHERGGKYPFHRRRWVVMESPPRDPFWGVVSKDTGWWRPKAAVSSPISWVGLDEVD